MTSLSPKPIRRVLVAADGRVKMQDQGGYQVLPTDDPDVGADEKVSQRVRPHKESRSKQFSDDPRFQCCMAFLIIANALVIGLETENPDWKQWYAIENCFLLVFVLELFARVLFLGPLTMFSIYHHDFGWNAFDVLVVGLGVLQFAVARTHGRSTGSFITVFRTIRLIRILRVFRIVKSLKQLYLLAFSLAEAAKAVLWVATLMVFVLYVCSVVLVKTVGRPAEADPHFDFFNYHFGSITESMLTLFVLMSSQNVPAYQDEAGLLEEKPFFCLFLVTFIMFGSFGIIAMLIGLITESLLEKNEMRKQEARLEHEEMRLSLGGQAKQLFQTLQLDANGEAPVQGVTALAPKMASMLDAAGANVAQYDMLELIEDMDTEGRGTINATEFMQTMQKIADGLSPLSIQEIHHEVGALHKSVGDIQQSVTYIAKVMQRLEDSSQISNKGVEDVQESVNCIEAQLQRAPKPVDMNVSPARCADLQDLQQSVNGNLHDLHLKMKKLDFDQSESNCELRESMNDLKVAVQKLVDRSESHLETQLQSPQKVPMAPSDFAAGPTAPNTDLVESLLARITEMLSRSSGDLAETMLARIAEMLSRSVAASPAPVNVHREDMVAAGPTASNTDLIESMLARFTEKLSRSSGDLAEIILARIAEMLSRSAAASPAPVNTHCDDMLPSLLAGISEFLSKQTLAIQDEVTQQCKDLAASQERALRELRIPQQGIEMPEVAFTAPSIEVTPQRFPLTPQGSNPLDESTGGELRDFSRESTGVLSCDVPSTGGRTRHAERHLDRLLEKMTKVSRQRSRPGKAVIERSNECDGDGACSPEAVSLDVIRDEEEVEEQGHASPALSPPPPPPLQAEDGAESAVEGEGLTGIERETENAKEFDLGCTKGDMSQHTISDGDESLTDAPPTAEPDAQSNSQED